VFDIAVLAAGPREPRMNVQIGDEHDGPILPRPAVIRGLSRAATSPLATST
jgi:hypothetical protein